MASAKLKELTKPVLEKLLKQIDDELTRKNQKPLKIVLLGAATILMLDIRDRGTADIDLAPCFDAARLTWVTKGFNPSESNRVLILF